MIFFKSKVTMPIRDKRTGRFVTDKAFKNVGHAIASIAKDARGSIKVSKKTASNPGQPPKTRGQRKLKKAIRYFVNKEKGYAVAGPRKSVFGTAAKAHEFGGRYKDEVFDKRPFMQPALERAIPRFPGSFRGSIGG